MPTSAQTASGPFFWSAELTLVFNSAGNWTLHLEVRVTSNRGINSWIGSGHTSNQAITQPFPVVTANWAATGPTISGSIHTWERLNV